MNGLDSGVEEPFRDLSHAAEPFFFHLIIGVFSDGEAHYANQFGPEALHPGDGSFDFLEGDFEGIGDLFGPVADGGSKAADPDAGFLEFFHHLFKGFVGDVMDVGRFKPVDLDGSGFNGFPA